MNKYTFTNKQLHTTIPPGKNDVRPPKVVLREICALIDIPEQGVKAGDVGGWLEFDSNLSHEGNCWVHKDSQVCGTSIVKDNATVSGASMIQGDSRIEKDAEVKSGSTVVDSIILDNVKLCSTTVYKSKFSGTGSVTVTKGFLNNTMVISNHKVRGSGNFLWGSISIKNCTFKGNASPLLIENTEGEALILQDVSLSFIGDDERHAITGHGYIKNLFGEAVIRIALKSKMEIENVLLQGKTCFYTLDGTKKYLVKGESDKKLVVFDSGIFAFKNPKIMGQAFFKGNIRAHALTAKDFSSIRNEDTPRWLHIKNVEITELARLIRSKVQKKDAVVAKGLHLSGESTVYAT